MTESPQAAAFLWRKSHYCITRDCVEVASGRGTVLIRDSSPGQDPVLRVSVQAWMKFIADTVNQPSGAIG